MKKISLISVSCLISIFLCISAFAANQLFIFECRTKIIRDNGVVEYENRSYTYNFQIEVISDKTGAKKSETTKNNHSFIIAIPEERYSIILHNPLPVQVAVNLTIDGLNSITGEPCRPEDGRKWIIDPYSCVIIRGWQVSGKTARRFYFTSKEKSYAKWRSNSWGKDLSVNCGVIGAAYFWNKKDMENYFENNPVYERTERLMKYEEAIEAYKQAIRIKPDDAEAYCNLGVAYAGLGRYEEAIDAYKQAIRIKPAYAEAYCNLGAAYAGLGLYQEAIESYKQAIQIKPDYAEAHLGRGEACAKLGLYQEAIESYKQAIRIKPDLAEAHFDLGVAYAGLGRYQEAIKPYKQAIQKAGTGMGKQESNLVDQIYFNYDTGMYEPHQAVIIYYDFAEVPPLPQPFSEEDFAPEQP